MKTLLIMRHAKSDYPPDVRDDFDRPLNERGRKDLPRVAQLLATSAPDPMPYWPRRRSGPARPPKGWYLFSIYPPMPCNSTMRFI